MKKRDVETYISNSSRGFAPDVLHRVMSANVGTAPDSERMPLGRKTSPMRLLTAVAAIVIILVCGGVFLTYMSGEAERVYIDVNPSLELVINRFGRVKEASFLNSDAEALMSEYKIEGKKPEDVIGTFVAEAAEKGYFDGENAALYISAYSKNGKTSDKILSRMQSAAAGAMQKKNKAAEITKQNCTSDDKIEADKLGISPGKMKLIGEIISLDPGYTAEGLKDKSMSELNAIARTLKADKNKPDNGNNADNGNNGKNGNNGNNGNNNGKGKK